MFNLKIDLPSAALELNRAEIRKALRQAGQSVAQAAKALIKRGGGSGDPSAPGEAPNSQTGTLACSLNVQPVKGKRLAVKVSGRAFYALALEAGGEHGNWSLEPRPFLSRALETQHAEIERRLRTAIEQGVQFKDAR